MAGATGPFEGIGSFSANWTGYYETRADGLLYAQFLHAFPAVIASLRWMFGDGALFHANTAIFAAGMSVVYVLVSQFLRSWIAALTTSIATITVVAFYFARSTYSEPLVLLLLALGIAVFYIGMETRSATTLVAAGAVIGATAMVRIDGWILIAGYVLAVALYLATLVGWDRFRPGVAAMIFAVPLAMGGLGMVDGLLRSPSYIFDRSNSIVSMLLITAASTLVALAIASKSYSDARRIAVWRGRLTSSRTRVVAGWGLLVAVLLLLFVRPVFFVSRNSVAVPIVELLEREGQPGGSGRNLAELTMRWFTFYWGWVGVALIIVGGLVILWSKSRGWSRMWFVFMIAGPQLFVYVLKPSIVPDHPWAMRRFYATILILFPLLMGIAIQWMLARIVARTAGWRSLVQRSLVTVLLLVAVAVPLSVSAPLLAVGPQSGMRASVTELCSVLPENSAVVLRFEELDQSGNFNARFGASVRSFCDVPTAMDESEGDISAIAPLASELALRGYVPVLITHSTEVPDGWTIIGSRTTRFPLAEATVLRAPAGAVWVQFTWVASTP